MLAAFLHTLGAKCDVHAPAPWAFLKALSQLLPVPAPWPKLIQIAILGVCSQGNVPYPELD